MQSSVSHPVAYPAHSIRYKNSTNHHCSIACSAAQNRHQDTQQNNVSARRQVLITPLTLGLATILPKPALAEDLAPPPLAATTNTPSSPPVSPIDLSNSQQGGSGVQSPPSTSSSKVPKGLSELTEEAARKLSEEEERKKGKKKGKGRIRELQEIRAELAEKERVLLEKQQELLEQEQTVMVLREELEIERKLRALLSKQVKKAEEEAALAMGLCGVGGAMLP